MINNQIQSPVSGKNSVISGQAPNGSKLDAGKQNGGLFKLLMNSVEGANSGSSTSANILGGNLTLNTQSEGEGKQSALHLLTGSGEESKEEKITLSRLLDGSESNVEASGEGESDEETKLEVVVNGDSESSENSDDIAYNSGEEAPAVEQQTKGEKAELPADGVQKTDTEKADQAAGELHQTAPVAKETTDGKTSVKGQSGATAETQKAVQASGNTTTTMAAGEQSTTLTVQQQAALSGDTADAGAQGSNMQQATGETKESNLLNGLIAGQESSDKGKQAQFGSVLAGETTADDDEGMAAKRGEGKSIVRPETIKSEGLVNELRALAAAQGETAISGQQHVRLSAEQLDEAAGSRDSQDATIQEIFAALQNGSIEQVAAEIRSSKASQMRETKYSNYLSSFANRQEISDAVSAFNATGDSSASAAATGSTATMMPVSTMVPGGVSLSGEMFDENGAVLWKEQITEYFESKEKSAAENQAASAFARLGEVPVTNISVKRSFAKGISQAILSSTGGSKKGSDVWQKHNFVLEDGKNIQVSARKVEGVLQLKLSSSYSELNKLLMEHENEIRDLLENELELQIDLQMDGGGDSSAAGFFGGSSNGQSGSGSNLLDLGSVKKTNEKQVEEVVPKAVRKFGYNQMEWTV
jgi:hypothetical protein